MSPVCSRAERFGRIARFPRADPDGVVAAAGRRSPAPSSVSRLLAVALCALLTACLAEPAHAACDPLYFCETRYPTAASPDAPVVGDFNADGIADVAIANISGSVTVHFGRGSAGVGDGTFAPFVSYPVSGQPFGLAAGDFNADGIVDLVTANYQAGTVSVLLGQGVPGPADGTFAPPISYPAGGSGPWAIVTGDFNEDGITDLAVSLNNCSDQSIAVLLGHGENGIADGSFSPATRYPVGCYLAAVRTRDLDSDGILDLAVCVHYPGTFGVRRGLGSGGVGNGTFGPASFYGSNPNVYDLRFADFNADGISDAVTAGSLGLTVLRGRGTGGAGDGTFESLASFPSTGETAVEVGDFNLDGVTDLVSVSGGTNILRLYLGQSTGGVPNGQFTLALERSVGTGPIHIATGDFNGDGRPDLAIPDYFGGELSILLNVGPNPAPPEAAGWADGGVGLSRAAGDQTKPRAVADGAGGAIAVWEDRRGGPSAIYAQRVRRGGARVWTANGIPIGVDSTSHTEPRIAEDALGGAWIGWLQPAASSPSAVRIHHVSASGALAGGLPPEGITISGPGFVATDLALSGDGAGGVLVAYGGSESSADAALYCQHVGAGGLAAPGWPAVAGIRVGESSGAEAASFAAPDLSPDGAGGAAITWRTRRASACGAGEQGPCVFSGIARVGADGTLLHGDAFRFPEDDACGVPAGAGSQVIATQPSGSELIARRIGPTGAVEWTTPLCSAGGERHLAALTPQAEGGASIVWTDRRTGEWDLFASRVDSDGALASGWPANGLGVCLAAGDQVEPQALEASGQGLTLCWVERSAGGDDLYALQLDANGGLRAGWPAGGGPVCTAEGDQRAPVLVESAPGGAIVIWQDGRSDNGDIYAQRISDPALVDVDPAPARPGLALAGARPNPARGVVWAAFSLPDAAPASLELFDVAGRRLVARDVGGMGAGPHLASLGAAAPLPVGLYVLRLSSAGRAISRRVVVTN